MAVADMYFAEDEEEEENLAEGEKLAEAEKLAEREQALARDCFQVFARFQGATMLDFVEHTFPF